MIFSDKAIHLALGTLSGEKRSSASKTATVCSRHLNNNFKILSVMKIFTLGFLWFKNQMAKKNLNGLSISKQFVLLSSFFNIKKN